MLFHVTVFFFSSLFFLALLYISGRSIVPAWSFYLIVCGSLISLSVIAARRLTGCWYTAYLPSTLAFSVPLLLSLIDRGFETRVFIIGASILYYMALLGVYRLHQAPQDKTARSMLNLAAVASLFFVFAATYGLYLNYEVPLSLLLGIYFLSSFIVSLQTLAATSDRGIRRQQFILSFVIGLLVTELMWVMHFWPFGYVTVGVAMLMFFFWFWNYALDHLQGTFIWKRAWREGLALLVLIGLLLLTANWSLVPR